MQKRADGVTRTFTIRRVATLLHRHPSTVRGWVLAGDLPATWVGDGYRIAAPDLLALVEPAHVPPDVRSGVRSRTRPDTRPLRHGYDEDTGGDDVSTPPATVLTEGSMPELSLYLSLSDAAGRVGRSSRTVRRWVMAGELPRALRIKGRLLIHPADLDAMYEPANPEAFDAVQAA